MPEVTLKINNRGYSLACDAGQEQRLVDLAHHVDSRLKDIASAGAATNEAHLLVLTSLVLSDEIHELRDELAAMRRDMNGASATTAHDEEIAEAIDHLAGKIEHIAARIHGVETQAA